MDAKCEIIELIEYLKKNVAGEIKDYHFIQVLRKIGKIYESIDKIKYEGDSEDDFESYNDEYIGEYN
mgnify:CR=1 FL=1